ncbi:MAG TPA: SPOR domain-containing protein [Candidatus Ozemobacteraceae bacterium]|nr:SPOR domain-containing protein [Candidatus Ozemobacteraceae bacterium]
MTDIDDPLETPSNPVPDPAPGTAGRSFDWGPPVAGPSEGIKEWAVYGLIVVLVSLVGWFLIDTAPDMPRTSSEEAADEAVPADATTAPPAVAPPAPVTRPTVTAGEPVPVVTKPRFHVQLGAFGDEETARSTGDALKKKGFDAAIMAPDDQYEMYRVLMGPFDREDEAEALARKLNELDFPCFVIESAYVQNREEEAP